ncbi:MAG: STAS domain-containing protein [Pelosinus sp.]|nr:STAS domain-containing protein [Pelosinus sp.]
MNYSIEVSGNQVNVMLSDKIYAHDAGIIRDELMKKIEQGATEIRMDLSDVLYIDSSGLGVLITVHKRTKAINGRLVLTGVGGIVAELIKRTRLDKVLTIE